MSKGSLVLLGLAAALWAALAIPVPAQPHAQTAADEPHYLLSAISLAEDRSLDVSDELRADRYRAFHRSLLPRQADARSDGEQVVPHDPLLPAVLALPMRVGGWVAAKLALAAVFGVLVATMAWTAIHRLGIKSRVALLVVATFAASAPLVMFGTQVYPEMLAALVVTCAVATLMGELPRRELAVLVAAVVALPWLSVKYTPTATVLVGIGLWQLVRAGRQRAALAIGSVLAAAAALFALAHLAWYGGLTAYASGYWFRTGELTVMGTDPDYPGRAIRAVGLLFDREFGLVVWQPAILLAIIAVAALVRVRPTVWATLVLPLAAGWFTATFVALTMHGWWFPGRQVVHVLPCAVLAVAWLAAREARLRPWLWAGLAYGATAYLWLVVQGVVGDLTAIVDFASLSHPLWRALRLVLPDYRNLGAIGFTLHLACIALVVALARAGWRLGGKPAPVDDHVSQTVPLQEVPA